VVLAFDLTHPGAVDHEDRHPLAVHAPDLDVAQLATAHEPEGAQEEILGLEHRRLLQSHAHGLPEESWIRVGSVEVRSVSPLISSRCRGNPPRSRPAPARLPQPAKLFKKPSKPETLSSGIFGAENIV